MSILALPASQRTPMENGIGIQYQFSGGFSTESITRVSTGPVCPRNFNLSCSCSAVKRDGPSAAGSPRCTPGEGGATHSPGSGVQWSSISKRPVRPVESITIRSTNLGNRLTNCAMVVPTAAKLPGPIRAEQACRGAAGVTAQSADDKWSCGPKFLSSFAKTSA